MKVIKKKPAIGFVLCILLAFAAFSCIESSTNTEREQYEEHNENTTLRFNWFLTETSKYNYTTSFAGVFITVEIENLTDSIFYLSNEHGDFFVKNKRNGNINFISQASFNPQLIYPYSKIEFRFIRSYYRVEKTEPSEDDFIFDLQYELRDSVFDKKSFYKKILDSEKHLIDTSKLFLVGNNKLYKTKDYEFKWLGDSLIMED